MQNIDPLTYIKMALSKDYHSQAYLSQRKAKAAPQPLVITLSRDFGALGEEIALGLAEALAIPVLNREILEQAAKKAHADPIHFQSHDEQAHHGFSGFLYSLMSGNMTTQQEYRRHLTEAILEAAQQDCILIGRGAHIVLAGHQLFRLRVVGSRLICAERIAEAKNIPLAEAQQQVKEVNQQRRNTLLNLYGTTVEDCALDLAHNFDLVLNTDQIPISTAVELILLTLNRLGLKPLKPGLQA